VTQPVPKWLGVVDTKGHLHLDERRDFDRYLRTLTGKEVEIVVRRRQYKRTLDQNAYWHGVCFPLLMEHFGYTDVAQLKLDLMGTCWGWTRSPVTGKEVPIKPSTSAMSLEEGTHFTDWLLTWSAEEHGVFIPSPEKVAA